MDRRAALAMTAALLSLRLPRYARNDSSAAIAMTGDGVIARPAGQWQSILVQTAAVWSLPGVACSLIFSALMTFRIVENSGFPTGDSAL